jgi:uncharacterized protein
MTEPTPLRARVIHDLTRVSPADWDSLRGSAFTEWAFLRAFETSRVVSARAGWQPHYLLLEEGDRLIAACPMYLKGNSNGEFVFDHSWAGAAQQLGVAYYPKAIIAAPLSPVPGPRILIAPDADAARATAALARLALDLTRDMGLSSIHWLFTTPGEADTLRGLGYSVRLGIQYHWHNHGYATFDAWLETFKSKRRRTIRRERRDLAALQLSYEIWEGDRLDDDAMRLAFRLYKTTIDKKMWGRQYLNEAFFLALGRSWRHRLMMIVARAPDGAPNSGEVIAGAFFIHEGGALFGRYWGCFQEVPFLHFELSYYLPVALCIERGWSRFEAGAQGEHKYERGFAPTLTYSAHAIHDPRLSAAVRHFLDQEGPAVIAECEGMSAASPCRTVHGGAIPSPDDGPDTP